MRAAAHDLGDHHRPSGRTLSGQTIEAFWTSIAHARPLSVGINCALGAREMRPYLAELSRGRADIYVSCYPNAGLPNAFGEYDETPDDDGRAAARVRRERPGQHRRRLLRHHARSHPRDRRARRGQRAAARVPRRGRRYARFSGLEPLTHPPRLQLPDDRRAHQRHRLASASPSSIKKGDFGTALEVALEQVRGGANILDVNMDEGMLDSEQAMTTFLNLVATEPDIARVPIMIDSSKWSVIEAGLQVRAGQADRQLDQPQGRRGELPRQGAPRPALRRRRGRDGLRRGGPGRHDRRARSRSASAPTGSSPSRSASIRTTSSSTRTSSPSPPASRSTTTTP